MDKVLKSVSLSIKAAGFMDGIQYARKITINMVIRQSFR